MKPDPMFYIGFSKTIPKKGYSLEVHRVGRGENFYKLKAMLTSRVVAFSCIVEGKQGGLYEIHTEDGYRYVINVIDK